ncbi:MAG TPA: isochorismate synthase [Acidimicrobiales bacterium]|nr:isochorismate synthase [Acidimicrobiales bacterium]
MSAPARLTGPDGEPIAAGALSWRGVRLGSDLLARARRHAFRAGRVIARDGLEVLSWGVAARIEFPRGAGEPAAAECAHELLAAIPGGPDGETAIRGPVALGALPFDTSVPGSLVIAGTTIVVDGGTGAAVAVGPGPGSPDPWGKSPRDFAVPESDDRGDEAGPDRFRVDSVRPHDDFLARVAAARAAIRAGDLAKVVLVREVALRANQRFRQFDLLERLRALHPTCAAFAIDGFVGASPELLVRRRDRLIGSRPLAGTVARSGDRSEDARAAAELLASPKDRLEHRYVVEAIIATFARHAGDVAVPEKPELLELRNVIHLATPVSGTLHAVGPDGRLPSALGLALELHPTPAVAGVPREAALAYLDKAEDLDRGRFAGPVGWFDASGDGEWWIGIRSAVVDGARARLFAGAGIVAASDPATELAETQLKLQALLAAFVRP